jgi:micrococcal nuclease
MNKSVLILALFLTGCYSKGDFQASKVLDEKENVQSDLLIENEVLGTFETSVVGIQDGDTIELRLVYDGKKARDRRGKNLRIRFAHINCPERGKPYYKAAKIFTSDYCFGKEVKIIHSNEFDRYGRLIGEVILPDGQNLNKMLVINGLAVHFKKYSDSKEYAALEDKAKLLGIGIWGE